MCLSDRLGKSARRGEERKGKTDSVDLQRAKIYRPVFGSDACSVHVEAYIPREILFSMQYFWLMFMRIVCNKA